MSRPAGPAWWRNGMRCTMRRTVARSADGALKTRVHCGLQLGQVLVAQADAVIVDFEGAGPVKRRAKAVRCATWRGLRSLDYAASVAATPRSSGAATASPAPACSRPGSARRRRLSMPIARSRRRRSILGVRRPGAEAALLRTCSCWKRRPTSRYESANRPGWIGVPLRRLISPWLTGWRHPGRWRP